MLTGCRGWGNWRPGGLLASELKSWAEGIVGKGQRCYNDEI